MKKRSSVKVSMKDNSITQESSFPEKITREKLNALVDKAADIIRTATDYKFILVLLFLKRISDVWKEEFEEKKKELMQYLDEKSAEKEAENEVYHTFNLKRELLWDEITKDIKKLPENLSNALIKIAELNPELKGVIDKFSFLGFTTQEHRVKLMQLVELFNQYNFGNKYVSSDIIGDAYEHILYRFAPTQAKEGEVYTPREVIQLLVEILDPKPGESVYDPACGSGGMLIVSYKYVRDKYGKEKKLLLYGQEYNPDIYGLCKLNLIAHGITDAFIEFGDSLLYPRFTEGGKLKQFDVVIANVPWNQRGYGEETLKKADFKERFFDYPPNNTADWAWVQHMLASAKENGRVGLIIDNGCLFRGGKEKVIRSKIVEKDLIEAVILLPEKLFYNTSAPGVIIIFNKNKPQERKNKILFINASKEYIPHPSIKRLNSLSKENIEKIVKAYREFSNIPGFSRVVDKSEIVKNDYNLNVTLYVMPVEEVEKIDISKEFLELKELEKEREEIEKKLEQYISEIIKVMND
ncbi:MAG: N-6 DNA methylase [Nanopusillaceae archaeon]